MAAGLGFKTFTTGEVLTAADTNGYLMQGVLVFASAAGRDAAITSPQEGQFAYLKDTNVTTYYTGSAWTNLDTTGMVNPMTTTGDTIYSSSGSTPARLGIGSTGQVLTVAAGIPSWATPASGGTWAAWTPTFNDITVGNGTLVARYASVGKIVSFSFMLTFGSTSSIGNNSTITWPVTPASTEAAKSGNISAWTQDLSSAAFLATVSPFARTTSVFRLVTLTPSVTPSTTEADVFPGTNVPFTWATGDIITIAGTYESA